MIDQHEVAVEVRPYKEGFRYRAMIYTTRPPHSEEVEVGFNTPIRAKLLHSSDQLSTYDEAMAYARGWLARGRS